MKKISQLYFLGFFSLTLSFAAIAKPLGLVDVYQLALNQDAELAQARAQLQADSEIMRQAKSLLLPKVGLSAHVNHTDSDEKQFSGTDQQVALNLEQPLFNKESFSRYSQAKSQQTLAEFNFQLAEQDLILRVVAAYFDALLAEQSVVLAQAKEDSDKIQWEKADASAEVGLASRTDVLQARSSYDLAISNHINSLNALDKAYESLIKLTGQDISRLKSLGLAVDFPLERLDKSAIELQAEANNLLVLLAKTQNQVKQEEINAQKSGHWFDIKLTAKLSDNRTNGYEAGSRPDHRDAQVGVQFNLPLYSGNFTSSQVAKARYEKQSANHFLRNQREEARLNARIQAQNLERGISLIAALREAVKSSEAFLESAEEGYRVGLRNLIDVVTARSNLFEAKNKLAEALHNQALTQLKLKSTLGDLSLDDLVSLDKLLEG